MAADCDEHARSNEWIEEYTRQATASLGAAYDALEGYVARSDPDGLPALRELREREVSRLQRRPIRPGYGPGSVRKLW